MKKAILTVGVSASGKSHMIDKLLNELDNRDDWVLLNRDEIRSEIIVEQISTMKTNMKYDPKVDNLWNFWKFTSYNEQLVTARYLSRFEKALIENKNLIFCDTNLYPEKNEQLISNLQLRGYNVRVEVFHENYEVLVKRDALRKNSVGAITIGKQLDRFYKTYYWSGLPEGLKNDSSNPPAILVDIDGTIAHMHGRSPFEWDRVDEDTFDHIVWGAVLGAQQSVPNCEVIFVSGRGLECIQKTDAWIKHYTGKNYRLFMRPIGSTVPDELLKHNIVCDIIKERYIVAVFDDRPKVSRMYRSIGLKLFQLGNPHKEF